MEWKAGQDGIFTFKGIKFKDRNYRIFSVASSPDEENIIIGTNIVENPSEFKAKLNSMEIGESIFLRGPFGSFFIPNFNKKIALIAGGIGITPIRAILKDIENKEIPTEITLLYVDSKKTLYLKTSYNLLLLKILRLK